MASRDAFSSSDAREPTGKQSTCPECEGRLRTVQRETLCETCGLVVDEDELDRGPEWTSFDDESNRRRVGAPLTAERHDRGLSTEIGRKVDSRGNRLSNRKRRQLNRLRREHRRSQWQSKRERNLAHGLGEVRRITSALGLSESIREQACTLFRRGHGQNLCQGRSLDGVAAASVYATCRCNGLGRSIEDVNRVARAPRCQIECAYGVMNTELELPTEVPQPRDVLPRLVSELDVPDRVRHRAFELVRLAEDWDVSIGRRPSGVAAACLYMAGKDTEYCLTQQEVAEVAGTSTNTLRRNRDDLLAVVN